MAALRTALERDPALRGELARICTELEPAERRIFLRELVFRLERTDSPAAAVLPALEAVARRGGEDQSR